MKKIINTSAPAVMVTLRTPLSLLLSIEQSGDKGGPLTQAQDTQLGAWIPDRTQYPLFLKPIFKIYDPDKNALITTGYTIKWYIVSPSSDSSSSSSSSDEYEEQKTEITSISTSDDYYKQRVGGNETGVLVVRKNVDYRSPVRIKCELSYTDNLRQQTYYQEAYVVLTAENKPEEFYTVDIEAPEEIKFSPFVDASSQRTLKAVAHRGENEIVASTIKFFWYADGTLITSSMPFYVSGQNTNTLIIDMDKCEGVRIAVRIADTSSAVAPNLPCICEVDTVWWWPDVSVVTVPLQGGAVISGKGSKSFHGVVQADGVDVPDNLKDEYVRLNWKCHSMNSGTLVDLGWGDDCVATENQLAKTSGENVEVYPDIYLLGPLEVLTDDSSGSAPSYNGTLVDDTSGSSPSYNGYCIGRT